MERNKESRIVRTKRVEEGKNIQRQKKVNTNNRIK